MDGITVGCGQITWIKFTPQGAQWLAPEEQVLAEIAQSGYEGAPAGPGKGSPEETLALYAQHGMRPAPGYLGGEFWKPEKREQLLKQAGEYARFMRAVGCSEVYVAAGGFDYVTKSGKTRSQLAGQIHPEHGLSDDEMSQFAATLREAAEITLREGVRSCFHNHVGSVIETRAEFERLLELVNSEALFLGPDTGHLAWAGDDPVAFCRDYASRIKTLHVKDINEAVAAEGRQKEWDYGTFSRHGVWTELGQGAIDFPAIFEILKSAGFQGWAIVETDVTQLATPLESAQVSRQYLRSIGI